MISRPAQKRSRESSASSAPEDVPGGQSPADADNGLRPVDGAYFEEVPIDAIAPNPRQPRLTFDEDALEGLAASIAEVGLLQPVVVRKLGPGRYKLVMGERRMAGIASEPGSTASRPSSARRPTTTCSATR